MRKNRDYEANNSTGALFLTEQTRIDTNGLGFGFLSFEIFTHLEKGGEAVCKERTTAAAMSELQTSAGSQFQLGTPLGFCLAQPAA